MTRYKFLKGIAASFLLAGVMTTNFLPVIAHANDIKNEVKLAFTTKSTPSGIADFGKGKASIIINGNNANQKLIGKKFNVYQLFNAQNSDNGESINYTINSEYAQALKNIIGKRLSKSPADVTDYEIIDYIQSLNNNKVEGANHNQVNEGRYSDFRYFVEDLRSEIVKLGIKSDVVDVTEVRKDNSIQLTGLDYGYYIVDEVSSVEGTHSASSLCMVNTANPNVTVQVKSDFPTVIKKIKEDDNITSVGDNGWNDIGDYEIGRATCC